MALRWEATRIGQRVSEDYGRAIRGTVTDLDEDEEIVTVMWDDGMEGEYFAETIWEVFDD